MSVEKNRAERLHDPNPKVDRTKIPTPQEAKDSFIADAQNYLPDFLNKIQAQQDLPEGLKDKVVRGPKIPEEIAEKVRESVARSLVEVGRPALEMFEEQKGSDVKVNEATSGLVDLNGNRVLDGVSKNAIRKSLQYRFRTILPPFIKRVRAQRGIRGARGLRIRNSDSLAA